MVGFHSKIFIAKLMFLVGNVSPMIDDKLYGKLLMIVLKEYAFCK